MAAVGIGPDLVRRAGPLTEKEAAKQQRSQGGTEVSEAGDSDLLKTAERLKEGMGTRDPAAVSSASSRKPRPYASAEPQPHSNRDS